MKTRALRLCLRAQAAILSDTEKVSSILRKCLTICQILGRENENEWIRLELNGYGQENTTIGELEKIVPDYRKVSMMYYDAYNKPILFRDEEVAKIFQSHSVAESISELEDSVTQGLYIYGAHSAFIKKEFNVPAVYSFVSPLAIRRIVDSVKNRALDFVNQIIIELEFGNVLSDIFEEARKLVDVKLSCICPEVLKNLVQIYNDLLTGKVSHDWKKIAFACRDILQDFTDVIYKPEYLPQGEMAPSKEQTKNKVRYTLLTKLAGSKNEERKLIEAQMEYFDKLTDYINKHLHKQASKEDAHRCVVYTYLIIGDILKLLEK